ncbi:hypothetical protein [Pedococcus sp.]|jgi:hypothetical protein|uniref:hypothetical protein n=1 Tax=Pedococcus sp. TaxID=2860345 RepID=UPI002E145609|nr:hypothetical protein [Pedococcus sp.]
MSEQTSSSEETLARITELARQALQAQASFARQSLELGRATLAGDVDRTTTGRAYVDAVSREGARYWREVGALGLDYAGELMALSSRTAARIISDTSAAGARAGARRDQPRRRGAAADGSPEGGRAVDDLDGRHVPVTLRGAAGQTARASVTVANQHPRARRVVLRPSELRDLGGTVIALTLTVDPDQVTLPAGEEQQVVLETELTAELVQPGERYVGTVEVSGGDEATLDVTVEVGS